MGTRDVPFLADLALTKKESNNQQQENNAEQPCCRHENMRAAWKDYTQRVLPHAFRQVRNFMLASIAEGRPCDDEEESMKRGDSLRWDLTQADVERALVFRQPEPTTGDTAHAGDRRVWECASLAVSMAELTRVG